MNAVTCTTCEGDGCLDCDQRGYELCDCCLSEPATSYDGETMVGERCARELALGDEATLDVTADTIPCAAVAS